MSPCSGVSLQTQPVGVVALAVCQAFIILSAFFVSVCVGLFAEIQTPYLHLYVSFYSIDITYDVTLIFHHICDPRHHYNRWKCFLFLFLCSPSFKAPLRFGDVSQLHSVRSLFLAKLLDS